MVAQPVEIRKNKDEVEVFIGNIKTVVKIKDLYNSEQPKEKNESVKIYKSMNAEPISLIITDMHYPIERVGEAVPDAGNQLIKRLQSEDINIPVIVCSSVPYQIPEILGTIWYDERRDLNRDIKELLDKL